MSKKVDAPNTGPEVHVMVAIPSGGMWYAEFALSIVHMSTAFMQFRVGNAAKQSLRVANCRGSILPKQRCDLVKQALAAGSTHILFVDCDHTFPRNMLHRLLSHNKDIVAANCVTKTIPSQPTARGKPRGGDPGYGVPIFTDAKKGLEQVWRVGTGVMLARTDVFRKTGLDIFHMYWKEEVQNYQGEDWTMCEAFEKAGFDIWVDHDVSREVGHIGNYTFTHDVVGEVLQEVMK